jgi:Glycosyl transferase family 2
MHARQIANLPDVHLKNLRMAPTQVYAFCRESFRKPVHLLQASSSTQLVDQLALFNIKVHVDAMIISIIVPTLNETGLIQPFLVHLRDRAARAEIIVADGGSCDGTAELAAPLAHRVVQAYPGRARQMNAGALAADGEILWFVHVDAEVPWGCLEEIERIMHDPNVAGGFFRIRLPQASIYRLTDSFAHYAGILLRMRCGDHGIFCRRTAFLDIAPAPRSGDIQPQTDPGEPEALRNHRTYASHSGLRIYRNALYFRHPTAETRVHLRTHVLQTSYRVVGVIRDNARGSHVSSVFFVQGQQMKRRQS